MEPVTVFQEIEERPGLLTGLVFHQAIPEPPIQVELEKGGKLAGLEQTIRAIGCRVPGVEMAPEDPLALIELFGDALLELAVPAQAEVPGVALHFHQVAGDRALREIEIEQGKIGPAHRYFVADGLRVAPGGVEQVHVGVERRHDLVPQGALIPQEQARQRHAEGFGPCRRRRCELERQTSGERSKLVEDDDRVSFPLGIEAVVFQHGSQERFQLGEGSRTDEEAVAVAGRRRGGVVDQVVGAVAPSTVVEELDAHVPIDGEHPVAGVVHCADEGAFAGTQHQTADRAGSEIRRRSGHGGGGRRDQPRKLAEQHRRFLRSFDDRGLSVARLALPPGAAGVIVVTNREVLDQAVKRDRPLGSKRAADRHLLGWKDVEEEAQV